MTGDSIMVVPDTRWVSFMYSYPNLIPVNARTVERIVKAVRPFAYDRIYSGWWDRVLDHDGKAAVQRSAERYIAAIRNWRLSRVESSQGGWTHCWEQEYQDLSGLQHDYMHHPFHWANVDGWFDAEDPKCIVEPALLHVFYEIESSILAALPSTDA